MFGMVTTIVYELQLIRNKCVCAASRSRKRSSRWIWTRRPLRPAVSRRANPRRSCLGDSGAAHIDNDPGPLLKIDGIVTRYRRLKIRDGEPGIESQPRSELGPRFVHSANVRQYCSINEMTQGEISIGLDRPTKPRGRLFIAAQKTRGKPGCQ